MIFSQKHNFQTFKLIVFTLLSFLFIQCKEKEKNVEETKKENVNEALDLKTTYSDNIDVPEGMVWIPGGEFIQGAVEGDEMAVNHEKPAHKVAVDGFFMDETEVTNAEFKEFVEATGYKTVAERDIIWEDIKKQLPPGTPKPPDSVLQPGSLIFRKTESSVPNLYDYTQWWEWKVGANWKHPQGPGSSIEGKEDYPVVHIAYEDAVAYSEWAGRRLPTEAEWEYAARGGKDTKFAWGDDASKLS
ncbi:MAG: SUMF1/EgtB/PvdO family nonheme iron enzyme, partial [Christiangramia sp.]|nr:SUMF1/EgtB/PvdO family nonheme iron enzyme [Christiangramia sp.]